LPFPDQSLSFLKGWIYLKWDKSLHPEPPSHIAHNFTRIVKAKEKHSAGSEPANPFSTSGQDVLSQQTQSTSMQLPLLQSPLDVKIGGRCQPSVANASKTASVYIVY
jgi:hypothetical protein